VSLRLESEFEVVFVVRPGGALTEEGVVDRLVVEDMLRPM
jgi:hypothetical protein